MRAFNQSYNQPLNQTLLEPLFQQQALSHCHRDRGRPSGRLALYRLQALWQQWQQRARTRRQLMNLSDTLLKDIGISRAEALHEGSKPFWR